MVAKHNKLIDYYNNMPDIDLNRRIGAVRRFQRMIGPRIGVLDRASAAGRFSETEARVILELGRLERATASSVGAGLGVDAGYMSRILVGLHSDGLVDKATSEEDRRRVILTLTARGRTARAELDKAARTAAADMLDILSSRDQERLVSAMGTVVSILAGRGEDTAPYSLRPPRPGDMGWVVGQHGILYVEEFGWEEWFEGLTAEVVAQFVRNLDPRRERCWIAEKDGKRVGSVFCFKEFEDVARLRMLLVGPAARGLGIGRRLLEECVRFARQVGYSRLILSTYDVLRVARRLYADLGFRLVREESHSSFGGEMMEETWELEL